MPARGDGLAILKWVTSFPAQPRPRAAGRRPGLLLLSDAETGELLAIIDCASVTSLRTGAAAAVSARALARDDAAVRGLIGCGVNGAWAARCLAAAGYGPGVCSDARPERGRRPRRRARLAHRRARRGRAARTSSSPCTPGDEPVLLASDLRPGQHLAVLGADAHGKAEVEADGARAAAASSATSGSRRRPAASWPAPVDGGRGRARGRDGDRRRDRRRGAGAAARRGDHPVRLDRASRSRTSGSRPRVLEAWRDGRIEGRERRALSGRPSCGGRRSRRPAAGRSRPSARRRARRWSTARRWVGRRLPIAAAPGAS